MLFFQFLFFVVVRQKKDARLLSIEMSQVGVLFSMLFDILTKEQQQ